MNPDIPALPDAEAGTNTPPFLTVTELAQRLKATVESQFDFVRIRAEISRPTWAASGHLYFTLKDDRNTLDGVCWKTVAGSLAVQPEEGLEVVVTGKLTIYGGRSKYQIVVQTMEVAGEGAMLRQLEERRRRAPHHTHHTTRRRRRAPPERRGAHTGPQRQRSRTAPGYFSPSSSPAPDDLFIATASLSFSSSENGERLYAHLVRAVARARVPVDACCPRDALSLDRPETRREPRTIADATREAAMAAAMATRTWE